MDTVGEGDVVVGLSIQEQGVRILELGGVSIRGCQVKKLYEIVRELPETNSRMRPREPQLLPDFEVFRRDSYDVLNRRVVAE